MEKSPKATRPHWAAAVSAKWEIKVPGPLPFCVLPSFGGSRDDRMFPVRVKTKQALDMDH